MNNDKLHQLHELSAEAWKWFRTKDMTEVENRDDSYWEKVIDDIAKMVNRCKYPEFATAFKGLLNTYAGQLQKSYTDYLKTKQERLPL